MNTEQVKGNIYFLFPVAFKSINLDVWHPYIHVAMVLLPEFKKKEVKCQMLCLIYLKLFPKIKPCEKRSTLFWGGDCLLGTTFAEVH